MKTKSALVGLLMLMIGCGCSSSQRPSDYVNDNMRGGDNVTKTDNVSSSQRSGIGIWPFLVGYFLGNRVGGGANGAVATPPQTATENRQNSAVNQNPASGSQSDLKARGSSSMRGSMGN